MNSHTMRIQTIPIKDINYEQLPLTNMVQSKIRDIKRVKILEDMKNNVYKPLNSHNK